MALKKQIFILSKSPLKLGETFIPSTFFPTSTNVKGTFSSLTFLFTSPHPSPCAHPITLLPAVRRERLSGISIIKLGFSLRALKIRNGFLCVLEGVEKPFTINETTHRIEMRFSLVLIEKQT